jgi:hypothetical protein
MHNILSDAQNIKAMALGVHHLKSNPHEVLVVVMMG